jgi:hypothetical protein
LRPGPLPQEHLGEGIGALQQPDQHPFQDRQQCGGAVADGGDCPDRFLERVPGSLHDRKRLRYQPAVRAGLLGGDDPLVVAPESMPGRLGVDDPAIGLHDPERDLPGGPDDGRPVRDGHAEGRADGGGGGRLGIVGPQVTGAPGGDLIEQADGRLPHPGAQRAGRVAGEQVPDRLTELAVGWAVHAEQVAGRVIARDLGAGKRGFQPVGHPPSRGTFYAQQILIPVDHVHGFAAGRGRDLGVVFGEHSGETAVALGSEGEVGYGGPVGRGVGHGHGGTPSAPRSASLPELRHQRAAPAPNGALRVLG